jgi:hypothetical protein
MARDFWNIESRRDVRVTKGNGKSTATADQPRRLPGPVNLNRPLQGQKQRQRRPPKKAIAGGRYKFKGNGNRKAWRSEDRRYKVDGNINGATNYFPPDCFPAAPLPLLLADGVRPSRAACSWGVSVNM